MQSYWKRLSCQAGLDCNLIKYINISKESVSLERGLNFPLPGSYSTSPNCLLPINVGFELGWQWTTPPSIIDHQMPDIGLNVFSSLSYLSFTVAWSPSIINPFNKYLKGVAQEITHALRWQSQDQTSEYQLLPSMLPWSRLQSRYPSPGPWVVGQKSPRPNLFILTVDQRNGKKVQLSYLLFEWPTKT